MKAKLKFNLADEFDREEFEMAVNAHKYKESLIELAEFLRKQRKYSEKESISLKEIEDVFYKIINDKDINLF